MLYLRYVFFFILATIGFYLYYVPFPYKSIEVYIDQKVEIGKILDTQVNFIRTDLCPYLLERRVFDSDNNKLFDEATRFSEPDELGPDSFNSAIPLIKTPEVGPAYYQVRISSMCNFVQEVFLNHGEWITVYFEFVKENK